MFSFECSLSEQHFQVSLIHCYRVMLEFKGLTHEFQVPPQLSQFIGMPSVVIAPSCGQSQTSMNLTHWVTTKAFIKKLPNCPSSRFLLLFQIFPTLTLRASIRLSGRNNASTELRWHLSAMRTRMREKHPQGLVSHICHCSHNWERKKITVETGFTRAAKSIFVIYK